MDIFQHPFQATENFTATGAIIQWGKRGRKAEHFPVLMTNLQAQYTRNINPIMPINTDIMGIYKKVNIIGAPHGVLQCDGLVTDTSGSLEDFLAAVNQSCPQDGEDVYFNIWPFNADGCDSSLMYSIKGLTLQTFVLQIQSAEVTIVRQPLTFVFTSMSLEYNENKPQ